MPDNIMKQDLLIYDWDTEEAVIPDTIWIEEWIFSKKKIRKLDPIAKQNNDDFVYHNLSPGFYPAKHKSDLDEKAKKAKEKREKEIKAAKDKKDENK